MESNTRLNTEKAYQNAYVYVNWGNGIGAFCLKKCEPYYSKMPSTSGVLVFCQQIHKKTSIRFYWNSDLSALCSHNYVYIKKRFKLQSNLRKKFWNSSPSKEKPSIWWMKQPTHAVIAWW